ncbi:hypothetical protein MRB53_012088 [Persea americana]|uniref:Uncharacterized protein n=1 Tax=Persea americana TaxID=3435 RepID=A0ACC2LXL7_PERAE|nr:hypothetical protein MRB53_012088 [Persea americana]
MYKAPSLSTKFQILSLLFLLSNPPKTTSSHTPPHLTPNVNPLHQNESYILPPQAPPQLPNLTPSDFIDIKIYLAYQVIQQFKSNITTDPLGITQTWVGPDVCTTYRGFYCTNPPYNTSATALAAIDFNGYGLGAPSINDFLVQLPDLAFFHANSNKFRGTISASAVSNLSFLYELDVSNNLMSGPFPAAVLSISNLNFLDLRFNSFSGSIPPQLFTLKLEELFINDNDFTQPLPVDLWKSPVNYITLANNRFIGGIPCGVGSAAETLVEVLLLNNKLTGCLPYEVGLLGMATVFDAGYNRLTGPIPESMGCMGRVEQLNLAGNHLYGQVPESVCRIGSLLNLSLSDNYFTSVGPTCMELIEKGMMDDRKNCIPGRPMQRSPAECIMFFLKNKYHCPLSFYYYYYSPCHHSHYSRSHARARSPPPPPSPSYSALHRHRL